MPATGLLFRETGPLLDLAQVAPVRLLVPGHQGVGATRLVVAATDLRKDDVVVPVALDNERDYRLAEKDVIAWLQEQPLELSELESKKAAMLRAERLAQLNVLRRVAARGKLGAALAWIDSNFGRDRV